MEEVSTVSQVNMYIKNMFVRDYALRQLRVKGEISNCKYAFFRTYLFYDQGSVIPAILCDVCYLYERPDFSYERRTERDRFR